MLCFHMDGPLSPSCCSFCYPSLTGAMPDLCLSQSGPFSSCFAFQSLLDDQGLAEVSQVAEQVLDAINKRLYKEATELWEKAEMVIEQVRGDALGASLLGFSPWVKGPWLVVLGLGSILRLPTSREMMSS